MDNSLIKKIGFGIEEVLLFAVIIWGIAEFLGMLTPWLNFLQKALSITAFTYLLYKVRLTRIFFGEDNRITDSFIVISFLLLSINKLIGFVYVAIKHTGGFDYELILEKGIIEKCTSSLQCFYKSILDNVVLIENYAIMIGIFILFAVSIYYLLRNIDIKSPSLLSALGETGEPETNILTRLWRFFIIFFVLNAFAVIVVSLAIEWLAISIDSTILVLIILAYLFVIVKQGKKFHADTLLYRMSSSTEEAYEKFVELFHSKKGLMIALSGLLVLHIVTDVGNFIIPTTLNIESLYIEQLPEKLHEPIFSLLGEQLSEISGMLDKIIVVALYLLNLVGILFIMLLPGYFWYKIRKDEKIDIPSYIDSVFFTAVAAFSLTPIYKLTTITSQNLRGVDIQTMPIDTTYLHTAIIICLAVLVISYLAAKFLGELENYFMAIISFSVFGLYIGLFFYSYSTHLISGTVRLLQSYQIWSGAYMFFVLVITIVFYFSSFVIFAKEVYNELKPQKDTKTI
ncbi:hypothetical protein ACFL0W_01670 [Nanoarchaeota archaeon]